MDTYITGIAFFDEEAGKWKDSCIPITVEGNLIRVKTKVVNRAYSFGLKVISEWEFKKNTHYREFKTEFGEIRRAFVIRKK